MTTLEKIAERVREAPAKVPYSTCSTCEWDYNELRCFKCEFGSEVHNPQYAEEIARWAVKLVAEGLKDELDKCAKAVKKAHDKYICVAGQAKIDAYDRAEKEAQSKVYEALLDLIDEASEKQAEEVPDAANTIPD